MRRQARRRLSGALSTLTIALLMTACSSNGSPTPDAAASSSATAAAPGASAVTSSAVPSPATTDNLAGTPVRYVIHYAAADGTKATVTFTLYPAVKSTDAVMGHWFPGSAPCQADPERDAIFAGTLTISNDTPGFAAPIQIALTTSAQANGAATLNFGAAYSNGPRCTDVNGEYGGYGAMQPAIVPTFNDKSTWGPVDVEFVVHGAYTPANPGGDLSVISANAPAMTAFEGKPVNLQQYGVTAAEGVTEGVQGMVSLGLSPLMP